MTSKLTFREMQQAVWRTGRLTFSRIYGMRPGSHRRELLLQWMRAPVTDGEVAHRIPVNNKWQANLVDPDLQYLLKRGMLVRTRESRGGGKRQTYLVLASR